MGKSKDLATGETRFVNTAGDNMTGNLGVNGYIDLNTSGNRAKLGYDSNNVYIGSTSGTGALYFKNNITSSDAPHSSGDTKMIIADNAVTKPNQPSMSGIELRPTPTSGYVTNSVNIYLGTVIHNTGNHWNNSTGVWTCPVDGKYLCYAAFLIDNDNGDKALARFIFRQNGTQTFISYNHDKNGTTYGGSATTGGIMSCAANDTITVEATHGQFHAGAESTFSICLLH